ncbi:hypothetical protein F5050DRAFT_1853766 [Lentinula boryana]|uniref:Uncharacterized protein n=1 Tax=Lentinula boryana TaxID=40481 RepID=A0ABQ8Q1Y7_9AGAR|nr:hypothetical protein F5050DRAFT_1853766 [Lentinula boryana]
MPRAPRQRPPAPEAPRWTAPAPPQRMGPAHPVWGYGADNFTTQLVQQFAEAEERERRPRKDKLTADRDAALRKQLSKVSFTQPLALGTKVNMSISLKRWQMYCDLILGHHNWKEDDRLQDGHRLPRLHVGLVRYQVVGYQLAVLPVVETKLVGSCLDRSRSLLGFPCTVAVYYLTLEELPKYESDQVRHLHDTIAVAESHLESPKKREKTVTNSCDLLVLLSFNIAYDPHALPYECQRLDLTACSS